jgi:tetratricopeptide (TPR) repeat protein
MANSVALRICFAFLISFSPLIYGCGNRNPPPQSPPQESYPGFEGINDSILRFPADAGLYFQRANRYSQAGAHEQASADYAKAWSLKADPVFAIRYASGLSILGRMQDRLSLLKEAAQKFPGDPQIQRLLGDAYATVGDPAMAIRQYDRMLAADSADFETLYEKGLLQEQLRDTAGAIKSLKLAYQLQPVDNYGLELAHLYAERSDDQALQICNAVLKKDESGSLIDPFFIKGIYYANVHAYPQAVTQFDSCIRRDWKTTDAYIEKGIIFFKQKKYPGALNIFQMAATVSNTEPDAYFWIGRCYEALGRKEDAAEGYQRALELDHHFVEAQQGLDRLKP